MIGSSLPPIMPRHRGGGSYQSITDMRRYANFPVSLAVEIADFWRDQPQRDFSAGL
jgi:hypothetical protein